MGPQRVPLDELPVFAERAPVDQLSVLQLVHVRLCPGSVLNTMNTQLVFVQQLPVVNFCSSSSEVTEVTLKTIL